MSKPAFDPSKPFEVVEAAPEAAKPKFDPSKPFEPVETGPSIGESVLSGVNQGLSFGFYDEIVGSLRAAGDKLSGSKENFGDLYSKHRDEVRNWSNKAKNANPKAYLAGNVAGNVATIAAPGVKLLAPVAKAGMAANVGKAALLSGAAAAGETEQDFGSAGFAKDVVKGAVIGGATQGALGTASKGAEFFAPSNLRRIAAERAVKVGTGQQVKAIRDLSKTGKLGVAGEDLLVADEAGAPVVKAFSRTEDLASRDATGKLVGPVVEKKEFFGKKISEVAEQIDELVPNAVSGKNIAQTILNYRKTIPATPGNMTLIKRLGKEAEYFAKKGDIGFGQAQKLKNSYKFKVTDPTTQHLGQDATNFVKSAIGGEMDDAAVRARSQIGDSLSEARDLIDKYERFKAKYGSFAAITKAAENRFESNLSNRFISPSDYFLGGAGGLGSVAITGEPFSGAAIGAASAILNKLARERGSAFVARSAYAAANMLQKRPEVLGKFATELSKAARGGAGALIMTHLGLMHDPQYRALVETETENKPALRLPEKTGLRLPNK